MAGLTTLVATLAGTLSHETRIPDSVKMLRVRRHLSEGMSASSLRSRFSGELLYSMPCLNSATARHESLIHAAREYDLVELDADHDLSPLLLQAIPTRKRLISWRGTCSGVDSLRSVFERIRTVPARFYSMILQGSSISDAVTPLLFLKGLGRRDVTAICEGKAGFCSRILAPHFGAPLVFGRLQSDPVGDSGEPCIQQLIERSVNFTASWEIRFSSRSRHACIMQHTVPSFIRPGFFPSTWNASKIFGGK
jgi:3-dehydroquinate dehydratase/shikimate dehydrogenase